jgi:aerobic-type carbon monoxide dehydrogenase small subunit (CoxS/CutS family)
MTVRWLLNNPELASRVDLRDCMSGNLCRCTGYDGVIAGVREAMKIKGITPRD